MYGLIFLIIGSYLLAPFLFLIIIIISSFAFYVYKLKNSKQYSQKNHREFWNTPCTYLAKFWLKLGKIFHGYEIVGLDKIPKDGPAILILYHPPGAIDAFFIISTVFLKTKRKIIAIVDRMNFKIPGFQTYLSGLEQTAGTVESCVSLLKNGEILLIYPGGMKECLSSSSYSLQWKKYAGFGKVGQLAKVPVIPVFTKNTREIFGFLSIGMASFIRPSKKIIGFLNDEIKPTQNYHCFAGAYYRKAVSSADYWVGIEGTVVLPQFYPDPDRLNITKLGKYLDNASIYLGGNSDSQETDIGLIWEIIRYENGSVSSDRLAFRPFMRRSAHLKTNQHALYQNAPANKSYYWYPDEIVNIRVQLVESGKLKFLVDGAGKRFEAIFEVNGYQFSNKAEYKRVNAIDQVGNEGKPVQTTKAKVIGTKWLNVHLLRKIESEVSRVVMHPGRFTNMKCPGLNFISVLSFGRESSIEHINLLGEGVF